MRSMLFGTGCLPSMAVMGRLSRRGPRRGLREQLVHALAKACGVASAEAARPAIPDREVGRIRCDYFCRLGIFQSVQLPEARLALLPPLRHAAALARETHRPFGPDREPQHKPFQASGLDHMRKDDFRVNFLRTLSYKGVLVPPTQRPPKSQTVIIFDWDDTLLCTSFLNGLGERPLTAAVTRLAHDIAELSQKLLEAAGRLGQTFIITNAGDHWVEHSTATWVPELLPALRNVRIISARAKFADRYPNEEHQWKIQAFLEVQRQLHSEVVTNLVSVGDSYHEFNAAHVMGKQFSQALIKTVKLREYPTPEDLHKELVLVLQRFEQIVSSARNMKVSLERKPAAKNAPQ